MSILKVENQINPSTPTYISDCPEVDSSYSAETIFTSRSEEINTKLFNVLTRDLQALYPDKHPILSDGTLAQNEVNDSVILYQIEGQINNDSNYQTTISFDHKEDPHNPGQQIYRTLTATFKSNQITSLGVSWSWEPNLKA